MQRPQTVLKIDYRRPSAAWSQWPYPCISRGKQLNLLWADTHKGFWPKMCMVAGKRGATESLSQLIFLSPREEITGFLFTEIWFPWDQNRWSLVFPTETSPAAPGVTILQTKNVCNSGALTASWNICQKRQLASRLGLPSVFVFRFSLDGSAGELGVVERRELHLDPMFPFPLATIRICKCCSIKAVLLWH